MGLNELDESRCDKEASIGFLMECWLDKWNRFGSRAVSGSMIDSLKRVR